MNLMRYFVALVVLVALAYAERKQTCVIIRHRTVNQQLWVSGANWEYVSGDFPDEMKWKSNITDRNVRKIKELGGKVVIVNHDYTTDELKHAEENCRAETASVEPAK